MDREEKKREYTNNEESEFIDYSIVEELKKNAGIKPEYLEECEKEYKKRNLSKTQEKI